MPLVVFPALRKCGTRQDRRRSLELPVVNERAYERDVYVRGLGHRDRQVRTGLDDGSEADAQSGRLSVQSRAVGV